MSAPYAGEVMWTDFFASDREVVFVAAIIVIVAVFIVGIVVSNRPDPKMALLLKLMTDFPKESQGEEEDSRPGSEEAEPAPYPRGHEFLS